MTGWRLAFVLPLALMACAPGSRCAGPERAQLRAVESQIAELERDMARGYRIEPAKSPETRLRLCAWPKEPVLFCTETIQRAQSERRVALDPVQAEAELRALQLEQSRAVARLADAQGRCAV